MTVKVLLNSCEKERELLKTIRKREDEKDGKSKNTFFQKIRP